MVALIENMIDENYSGTLRPADLELIERVIYKNGDDIAISISRSFERLEEKLDAIESRLIVHLDTIEKEFGAELLAVRSLIKNQGGEVIGKK